MTSPLQPVSDKALQEQALQWFTRKQSGSMSDTEQQSFAEWLASDERHANSYQVVESFWQSPEFSIAVQRSDQQHGLLLGRDACLDKKRVLDCRSKTTSPINALEAQASKKSLFKRSTWAIAASILVMVVGLGSLNPHRNADHMTAIGEQQQLTLDDGSKLTLNTGSAVNVILTSNTLRKVELLVGEIYLDVTKDPAGRPFQVIAGDALIEVLGTQFSVKHDKNVVVVSGHSGRIAVSTGTKESTVITAGERLRVSNNDLEADTFNTQQDFAWLNKRLVFSGQPLRKVITELDRYYPGKIAITNSKAANTRISGSYSLSDPKQVATTISQIAQANSVQLSPWLLVVY